MNTLSKVLLAVLIAFLAFAPTTNEPVSRWDWHRSPNPSQDLRDALFGTNLVLATYRYVNNPFAWFDANEGYGDDDCFPASDSVECESCLASAALDEILAYRACDRERERSRKACSKLSGLAQRRCLDDTDEDYEGCESEADVAYADAEASCEASECYGDC